MTGVFGIKAGGKKMADLLATAGTPSWMYSFDYRGQKRHTMSNFLFTGSSKVPFEPGENETPFSMARSHWETGNVEATLTGRTF